MAVFFAPLLKQGALFCADHKTDIKVDNDFKFNEEPRSPGYPKAVSPTKTTAIDSMKDLIEAGLKEDAVFKPRRCGHTDFKKIPLPVWAAGLCVFINVICRRSVLSDIFCRNRD